MGRSLMSTGGRGSGFCGGRDTSSSRSQVGYGDRRQAGGSFRTVEHVVDTLETHESDGLDDTHEDVAAESSHIHHGADVGTSIPDRSSERPRIQLAGATFNCPKVGHKAVTIVQEMFLGPWATWTDVDNDSKAILFQRFKNNYTWDEDKDELFRTAWSDTLKGRWRDMMVRVREKSIKRALDTGVEFDGFNFKDLIPFGPNWIHIDYWTEMILKKWNTSDWKKTSLVNKRNRMTLHDGMVSKHTGGSISNSIRRWRFVKAEGREPTATEMFVMTHKTKGSGRFITSKAEKFADDYVHEMIEKYGPDTSIHPLGDVEVWERCAGGRKRGQMYGVGTCSDPSYVVTGSRSGWNELFVGSTSNEVQQLKEKIKKMEEERAIEKEENARRAQREKENQDRMKAIEEMLRRQFPPSTSDGSVS